MRDARSGQDRARRVFFPGEHRVGLVVIGVLRVRRLAPRREQRLAELLGPGYGVGLHHDQSGHIWNEAGAEDHDLAFLIKDLGIDPEKTNPLTA